MSLFDRGELKSFLEDTKNSLEHIESKKADKLTRKEFLKWLKEFIDPLKEEIKAINILPKEQKEYRVKKAFKDFNYFRRTYFPHYYKLDSESKLQQELKDIYYKIRDKKSKNLPGQKFAIAAPRGFGKSTDIALTFIIWVIAYKLKHFITLFSDAIELTELEIEAIKAELEENKRLSQDFSHIAGVGSSWKVGDIVTKNNIRVKGYGSGKRVRGVKHGTYRVDLAVIDDLENDENVKSPKQRDKLEEWLDSAVDNLGGVDDKMDIIYIGTVLHKDSVLARKLKLAFWHPKIYKAIERFPKRMDLWDNYESLYKTKGEDKAHSYYLKNKAQMDSGAKLLWEAVSLESLMKKRIRNKRAFEKEQQNNPGSEFATFDSAKFKVISKTQMPNLVKKFLFTDFKGDSIKGDYFALVAGGFDSEGKKLYVYYSYRAQLKGVKAVNHLVSLYDKERFYLIGGETNGGFYLYRDWFKDKCIETLGVIPNTKFIHNKDKKEDRIAELEFPLSDNDPDIIFVGEHPELFRELDDFPESKNDDLSDALSGLWRLCKLKKNSHKRTNKRYGYKKRFKGYK